jgi:hypothetical protein
MEHEQFMQNLRYSRRLEKLEKEGGSIEDMKPPVNLLERNYVFCEHCQRKFAPRKGLGEFRIGNKMWPRDTFRNARTFLIGRSLRN